MRARLKSVMRRALFEYLWAIFAEAKRFRLYLGTWPERSDWCNRPFELLSKVGFRFVPGRLANRY